MEHSFPGYDGLPIESMQGLDINSGGVYGNLDDDPNANNPLQSSELNFDQEVPQPPNDNNQVAAWYDTDL